MVFFAVILYQHASRQSVCHIKKKAFGVRGFLFGAFDLHLIWLYIGIIHDERVLLMMYSVPNNNNE